MRDESRTEAEAARAANVLGRSEHVGSDVGSQEPDVAWAKGLGPDPWLPFVCPACSERTDSMPETCPACGWRNYGTEISE